MRKYIPRLYKDTDFLLLDNAWDDEECLNYAAKHHFNVRFTDTGSSKLAEIMLMFKEAGFMIDVVSEKVVAPDGLVLSPKPIVLFLREE